MSALFARANQRKKEWRKNNLEKARERELKYREKNKEKFCQRSRKDRQKIKEEFNSTRLLKLKYSLYKSAARNRKFEQTLRLEEYGAIVIQKCWYCAVVGNPFVGNGPH